jgi:hypothetical protein
MGCCSLLAIQQVLSVDPHIREDLDYGDSADQPDVDNLQCGYQELTPLSSHRSSLEAQQQAEAGERSWAFDNPQRVATEGLSSLLRIDPKLVAEMRQTRKVHGRAVYEWRPGKEQIRYMVVVSRPYWLSFYAEDEKKVPWVVIAAYKMCGD